MHPHHLHATAALWSLTASWPLLHHAAAAARLSAADGLRSTIYGARHSTGDHSDGAASALVHRDDEQAHWAGIRDRVAQDVDQACWLIRSAGVRRQPTASLLAYIRAGLPGVDPATARDIAGYLQAADRTARRALQLPPTVEPLPGVDCPACSTRMLEICTAAPDRDDWTVTCGARCRCTGTHCPCGNPATGVPHIWLWTAVVAGVSPLEAAA